jgi:hypothetical protein
MTDLVGVCDSSFQTENTQLCIADDLLVFAGGVRKIADTTNLRGCSAKKRGCSAKKRGCSAKKRG